MKKIISSTLLVLFTMFYLIPSGIASELYFIKNGNKSVILPSIQNSFNTSGYTIKNNDPVYGVKGSYNVVAIVEQSGNDSYYFIDNTVDSDLTKKIKSAIKTLGYSYKKVNNDTMSMSYSQTVLALKKSLSTETKTYDFSQNTNKTSTSNTINNINYNQNNTEDNDVWTGYICRVQ